MRKRICSVLAALFSFSVFMPIAVMAESEAITENKIGRYGDFDYELWRDKGNASMTLKENGTFECEWDKSKTSNVLFRTGKKLGSTKTYDEYGDIIMEYGAEYKITAGDVSYLCVYGWTTDPLVEFYIVENYGNYKPPGGTGYQGTIEVDGGTYDVYTNTRVNMPSIQGNKTFPQYFSVRKDKRSSGTITISDHFKAWEELGLEMSGKMYEVSLCVEGYNSSGNANVYSHQLTIGDTVFGAVAEPPISIAETTIAEVTTTTETTTTVESTTTAIETSNTTEITSVSEVNSVDASAPDDKNNSWIYIIIVVGAVAVLACVIIFILKKSQKTKN